jgi:hypothetical protein
MGVKLVAFALMALLCGSSSGCIFAEDEPEGFDLIVNSSISQGTIVESYENGDLISAEYVYVEFDFSSTKSDLKVIGFDLNDGSNPVEGEDVSNFKIVAEFNSHGKYNVSVYGINSDNVKETTVIEITIDLRIEWMEDATENPATLTIDPIPKNEGEHPLMFEIQSRVTNPSVLEDFNGGQSVQISWTITDGLGDTCQRKDAVIEDGESETWETLYFNTYLIHDLDVLHEEGEDRIEVSQTVLITYSSD